jgi:rhodanese-related sulfurtransferase
MRRQHAGVTELDTRAATPYASGHVAGSVQIGLGGQFASWAGALVGLDCELILVAEDDGAAGEARMRLARVGIEKVQGYLADGIAGWARAGLPLARMDQISVPELREEMASHQDVTVVDVRRPGEWEQGHIEGAMLHPLDRLPRELESLDRSRTLTVHCKSGYRSMIACSLLEGAGFPSIRNLLGGYDAWSAPIRAGAH